CASASGRARASASTDERRATARPVGTPQPILIVRRAGAVPCVGFRRGQAPALHRYISLRRTSPCAPSLHFGAGDEPLRDVAVRTSTPRLNAEGAEMDLVSL